MTDRWMQWENEHLLLRIRVQPKASRDEIVGVHDGCLKVRITAPPVDGKANKHLADFLAKQFGVSRSEVTLLSGHSSKTKRVRILHPARLPETIQLAV